MSTASASDNDNDDDDDNGFTLFQLRLVPTRMTAAILLMTATVFFCKQAYTQRCHFCYIWIQEATTITHAMHLQ
jgi:hypothetical protein